MKLLATKPQVVLRDGKPAAVILEIDDYEELLERVEDAADLKRLAKMRKRPLRLETLDAFLSERPRRAQKNARGVAVWPG